MPIPYQCGPWWVSLPRLLQEANEERLDTAVAYAAAAWQQFVHFAQSDSEPITDSDGSGDDSM